MQLQKVQFATAVRPRKKVHLELEKAVRARRDGRPRAVGEIVRCRPERPVLPIVGGAALLAGLEPVVLGSGHLHLFAFIADEFPVAQRVFPRPAPGLYEDLGSGSLASGPAELAPGHRLLGVDAVGNVGRALNEAFGIDLDIVDFPRVVVFAQGHLKKGAVFVRRQRYL